MSADPDSTNAPEAAGKPNLDLMANDDGDSINDAEAVPNLRTTIVPVKDPASVNNADWIGAILMILPKTAAQSILIESPEVRKAMYYDSSPASLR